MKFQWGSHPARTPNTHRPMVGKMRDADFRSIYRFISESVPNRNMYSYHRRLIKSRMWSIERYHFQWRWVTPNTKPTQDPASYGPFANPESQARAYWTYTTVRHWGSAEALVRSGGKSHQLIASCLSNISAEKYQNRLMHVEVIARKVCLFWDTV